MELQRGFLLSNTNTLPREGFDVANPYRPLDYRSLQHQHGYRAFLTVKNPGCYEFAEQFALGLQKDYKEARMLAAVGIITVTDELIQAGGLFSVDWEGETYPITRLDKIASCTSLVVPGRFLKPDWLERMDARFGLLADKKFIYKPFSTKKAPCGASFENLSLLAFNG